MNQTNLDQTRDITAETATARHQVAVGTETDYFDYLQCRSALARFYRRRWLYPKLCRFLSGRVLDVGCGVGDMLAFRKNTIGVDVNPSAVAWCRANGHEAHLMKPDVLPFQAEEFDDAVIDNVLEHIADPQPLLAEVRRVIRPDGRVVIGVPGARGYRADPDHKVYYDETALVATMAAGGFRCEKTFFMPVRCAWLDRHMRQYCMYGVFRHA